ncbi:MAG: hypothetical protein ACXAC7_09720 [Candidatus Hodarchaeales archaeon]|jgi:hypothetical protein
MSKQKKLFNPTQMEKWHSNNTKRSSNSWKSNTNIRYINSWQSKYICRICGNPNINSNYWSLTANLGHLRLAVLGPNDIGAG